MYNYKTKILDITINNFKNTIEGFLPISNPNAEYAYESDIVGIYGQNGSGKSTIIDVMEVFRDLATSNKLQTDLSDFIMVTKKNSSIKITFLITHETLTQYIVTYCVVIGRENNSTTIISEEISYHIFDDMNDNRNKNNVLHIDFDNKQYQNLDTNKSYLFKQNHTDDTFNKEEILIINIVQHFAKYHLFIISNKSISVNSGKFILPHNSEIEDAVEISFTESTTINKNTLTQLERTIESANIVLNEIIPKLSIQVEILHSEADNYTISLLSLKNELAIPLAYESEGIKKIVSVISVLIALFNSQVSVFIDEIDTGIYEYLLGEILEIVEERAIGQLIFTSHNLRPLEVLNSDKLVFTTNNPNNRYIKLSNVDNSNIRDLYYRDIVLGGQSEEIYAPTKASKIARAFRKAGHGLE